MNLHLPPDDAELSRSAAPRPRPALRGQQYRRFHPQAVALDAAPRSRFARPGLLLLLATVLLAIGAAFFIRLPVVEPATGMIIPAGLTIEIRTIMSGEVVSLDVTEGGIVQKGATLLSLDSSVLDAQIASFDSQLAQLALEQTMLDALVVALEGNDRDGAVAFDATDPAIADRYQREFTAQVSAIFASLDTFAERDRQLDASLQALQSERETLASLQPIHAERVAGFESLAESGSGTRADMLNARQALIEVDGQIDAAARRIEEAGHEKAQVRLQADSLLIERIADYSARNRQIQAERARLGAQRSEIVAQRDRQVLRAPVDSVVNQLRVAGPGVNVIAEEHLMTLVPLDDHVIVEAMVANSAIAFVEVGQTALLKLDALPFQRYGTVPGEVISVGATSVEASPGDWRYPVRIAVQHDQAETSAGQPVLLRPGMTLRADILTEERSLASYFLDVVTAAVSEGMGER